MMDLAGNAFTGTVFQAVALGALTYAPLGPKDGCKDTALDEVTQLLTLNV